MKCPECETGVLKFSKTIRVEGEVIEESCAGTYLYTAENEDTTDEIVFCDTCGYEEWAEGEEA